MIGLPLAHVAGIPIEETLAALGPALLALGAVASARLNALIHNRNKGGT